MLRSSLRGLLAALLSFVVSATATAQTPLLPVQALPAPPALMTQFDVTVATLQSLLVPQGNPAIATVDVVLGGRPARLALALHDVRAPGFQLFASGPNGLVPLPAPPCVTYRGEIQGDPGSSVAATIDGGSVTAFARTGGGELWLVQPVNQVQPAAGAALHIVFRGVDSVLLPSQCGVNAPGQPMPTVFGEDTLYGAELAIEADFPFYQLNGSSTTATTNDVTGIVNAMNVIYERDVSIRLLLGQLIINTTTDAYTTSVASTLLSQFRSRWTSVNAGVPRDIAHLFTGRSVGAASSGTIGIAYVGAVCSFSYQYGLSQSRFSNNYGYRVGVTAHEIGHNFNAAHCNSTPPCNIMCSGIGGCNANVSSFGAPAQSQIVAYRQSIGCLSPISTTPVISGAAPTSVKTVLPGWVTLSGTGFTGATRVNVGTSWTPSSNIQVVNDTQLRFLPPQGMPLGFQVTNVVTPAGTSNSIALLFTAANPAELVVPAAVIGGNTLTWTMGGWNGDIGVLVISLASSTTPWLGWNLVDSPTVLWQGLLDARGMGTYSFPVPAGVFSGLQVYSQLIDLTTGTISLRSLSTIKPTLVIL